MAEMRESSVLISLNQLMHLEQQRVREEDDARRRTLEAAERARLDAERKRRAEHEERLRVEEARRFAEEASRREEAVRHEAIRLAAQEKARLEAAQRSQIAILEQEQKHERDLAALRQDAQKRRLQRTLVVGGALAVLLLGGAGSLYFGKLEPEAEQAKREQAAQLAASEASLTAAKDAYDKAVRDADAALAALRVANDEAARLKAQQAVDAADQQKLAAKGRLSGAQKSAGAKTGGSDGCVCEHPGDPMCGCLNH